MSNHGRSSLVPARLPWVHPQYTPNGGHASLISQLYILYTALFIDAKSPVSKGLQGYYNVSEGHDGVIKSHYQNLQDLFSHSRYSHPLTIAMAVGLLYLLLSVLWILFSDHLAVQLAADKENLILIQKYKGIGFVLLMTVLIAWLVYALRRRGHVLERALQLVRTDPITGLANRGVAEEYLAARFKDNSGDKHPCGVLLLDVRGLNRVNFSVGRSGGDRLLRMTGKRLQRLARHSDLVARLEGDRFVMVFGALDSESEALGLGARIRSAFEQSVIIDGVEIHVELRGGLAIARRDGNTPFELLDAAERALFRSKKSGHELDVANSQDLISNAGYLMQESLLRRAIREHQFSIALQPQIELDNFSLTGAEVLARWHSPERGEVSPGEFIPLAESLGLIQEITEQVFQCAEQCVRDWIDAGLPVIHICINLSGLDLKTGRILELAEHFLTRTRLPGQYLTLEITESWLMEDHNLALGLVYRLREMGVRIAIDDFGTGYSALSQLIEFPFDYVKLDRTFITGLDRQPKKIKVLTAIQRMAATLGVKTIAEGVETIDELELLEQLGFDEVQGYLLGKPVPVDTFVGRYLVSGNTAFQSMREKLEKRTAGNRRRATRIGPRLTN